MPITSRQGRLVQVPTVEEDARIDAGRAADEDSMELTDDFFARARPAADVRGANVVKELVAQRRARGRPLGSVSERTKVKVNLRVDPEVLEALRGTGAGWQTRVNDVLRREFLRSKP